MANKERGEKSIVVGGRTWVLRPTFDALCKLEEVTDKPLADVLAGVNEGRVSGIRAVVFALLQDNHERQIRTLKDASRWIEDLPGGADEAMDLVIEVFRLNAPEDAEGGAANPPTAQAGTGVSSDPTLVGSV